MVQNWSLIQFNVSVKVRVRFGVRFRVTFKMANSKRLLIFCILRMLKNRDEPINRK